LLSILTPVYVLGRWTHINSSNENLGLPIVEGDEFFALYSKETTAKNGLNVKANAEGIELLKIFIDFYLVVFSFDSENVLRWVDRGPD